MEPTEPRNRSTFYILLFIIAAVGISFALYVNYQHQKAFSDTYSQGRRLYAQRSPLATYQFEEAVKNAKSTREQAAAKLNLGTAYLLSDPVKGAEILKQVSVTPSYPPEVRSASIVYVIQYRSFNFPDGSEAVKFAQDHIYTGEQWASFLRESSAELSLTDILNADEKALEWSASIHSTALVEFAIANSYGRRYLDLSKTDQEKSDLPNLAEQRYKNGEAELQATLISAPSQIALTYMRQGQALDYLRAMNKTAELKTLEKAFRNSLDVIEKNLDNSYVQMNRLFVKFRLASVIARANDPARNDEVRSLLHEITATPTEVQKTHGLYILFQQLKTDDVRKVGYYKDIRKLASIDEEFHQFLLQLGWKESDFR